MKTIDASAAEFGTRLLLVGLLVAPCLRASAAAAPEPGQEELVQITSDLPRRNGFYHYEFNQPISQGERLHVTVSSVGGAEIRTQIVVSLVHPRRPRGKLFEHSRVALSQDWTMQRRPPGEALLVCIKANALGKLRLRVEKVAD
jgi:hypothetical protein